MVKSKSAGYICPSLKSSNIHRFSLIEGSNSFDETQEDHKYFDDDSEALKSLLPQIDNYNSGSQTLRVLPFILLYFRSQTVSRYQRGVDH